MRACSKNLLFMPLNEVPSLLVLSFLSSNFLLSPSYSLGEAGSKARKNKPMIE